MNFGKTPKIVTLLWALFFILLLCIGFRWTQKFGKQQTSTPILLIPEPLNTFYQTVFNPKQPTNRISPSLISIEQGGTLEGWIRGWMATPEYRSLESCSPQRHSKNEEFSKPWQIILWKRLQWLREQGFQPQWNSRSQTHLDRSFEVLFPTGEESTQNTSASVRSRDLNEIEFSRQLNQCNSYALRRFWIEALYEVEGSALEFEKVILENPPAVSCPSDWVLAIDEQMKIESERQHKDAVTFLLIWQFFCHYPSELTKNIPTEGKSQ